MTTTDPHPEPPSTSAPTEAPCTSTPASTSTPPSKKPPGGYDPTPLPPAPPGYTVRITFQRTTNLPIADLPSCSSDPFILATLRAPGLPRRHKADPDLTHQTPTLHRTTEPVWDHSWTVANVPATGFSLRIRLFDEDYPDKNDRLGHVSIVIPDLGVGGDGAEKKADLGDEWRRGRELLVKKRTGSKRAYAFRGCLGLLSRRIEMTPRLYVAIEVLGVSDPPHGQMYTLAPTYWIRHHSPMIGRITGTKVNADENDDHIGHAHHAHGEEQQQQQPKVQRYNFQANEMQLSGPVPAALYHRYVEFRPIIGSMFSRRGLAGRLLNGALHRQHARIYNFDKSTERAPFVPRSRGAALQFLRMAHFDEGGRVFTYVLTLDGMLRFTETGPEFGIDLLSKHSMHSDVANYIACSGEFFIRRLPKHHHSHSQPSSPSQTDGPPNDATTPTTPRTPLPPPDPALYQLIIDNNSGTYRPDKSLLPQLRTFLERELPNLSILALHWEDPQLIELKTAQLATKRRAGRRVNMILNTSPSSSSLISGASRLDDMEREAEEGRGRRRAKVERAVEALEHPKRIGTILAAGGFVDDGDGAEASGSWGGSGSRHNGDALAPPQTGETAGKDAAAV